MDHNRKLFWNTDGLVLYPWRELKLTCLNNFTRYGTYADCSTKSKAILLRYASYRFAELTCFRNYCMKTAKKGNNLHVMDLISHMLRLLSSNRKLQSVFVLSVIKASHYCKMIIDEYKIRFRIVTRQNQFCYGFAFPHPCTKASANRLTLSRQVFPSSMTRLCVAIG